MSLIESGSRDGIPNFFEKLVLLRSTVAMPAMYSLEPSWLLFERMVSQASFFDVGFSCRVLNKR